MPEPKYSYPPNYDCKKLIFNLLNGLLTLVFCHFLIKPTLTNATDPVDDVKEGESESIGGIDSNGGRQRVATVHQYLPKTTLPVSLATGKPTVCSVIGGGSDSQLASSETSEIAAASPPPTPPHLLASPPAAPTTPADLTDLLERALGSSVPLLKEIFFDFETFLAKTLVGSHGQDLLLTGGLSALRNSSLAVEIVMLLCSQVGLKLTHLKKSKRKEKVVFVMLISSTVGMMIQYISFFA